LRVCVPGLSPLRGSEGVWGLNPRVPLRSTGGRLRPQWLSSAALPGLWAGLPAPQPPASAGGKRRPPLAGLQGLRGSALCVTYLQDTAASPSLRLRGSEGVCGLTPRVPLRSAGGRLRPHWLSSAALSGLWAGLPAPEPPASAGGKRRPPLAGLSHQDQLHGFASGDVPKGSYLPSVALYRWLLVSKGR